MGQPYVGEIRMFGGNFNPNGWALCNGQLLPISENEVLFSLIGTTYGGDGQSTFGLPNLQSRVPLHPGTGKDGITYQLGEMGGVEDVTLTVPTIPNHAHLVNATTTGNQEPPTPATLPASAAPANRNVYGPLNSAVKMYSGTIAPAGGSQPHSNIQPYLAITFIISLYGIFPSQN